MIYGCLCSERLEKSQLVISSFLRGWPGRSKMMVGPPPDDGNPFVVYGQRWLPEQIVPVALEEGRPFWQIDNGFWLPGRGNVTGYYRVTYRGLAPLLLQDCDHERVLSKRPSFKPWRSGGKHILFAHPGLYYGRCVGLDMPTWIEHTRRKLTLRSRRPVLERDKYCSRRLADDLENCWVLVTHSSNVAIDAVIAGVPVIVAASNPAAPVGSLSLDYIEVPKMPPRGEWWRSLMCQQFTLPEMRDGTAYRLLSRVRDQVDGELPVSA